MAKVPVTPSVLSWAMDRVEVDNQSLSDAIKVPEKDLQSWLTGESSPHMGKLREIAKFLGLSPYFFLRPNPPESTSSTKVAWRTALESVPDASPDERRSIIQAGKIQRLASWIIENENDENPHLPELSSDKNEAALELSTWLQLDVANDQIKQTSKTAVFRAIRSRIEDRGIIVVVDKFGNSGPQGYSLPSKTAPLLVINGDYDLRSVRTYTMLHELCHLAAGNSTIDHYDNPIFERWAEEVVAAILLPVNSLKTYLDGRGKTRIADTDLDSVRLISERYGASWKSVAIRLKELGIAGESLIDNVNGKEPKPRGFNPNRGPTRPELRVTQYGYRYTTLLRDAVETGMLSSFDARRYLDLRSATELQTAFEGAAF